MTQIFVCSINFAKLIIMNSHMIYDANPQTNFFDPKKLMRSFETVQKTWMFCSATKLFSILQKGNRKSFKLHTSEISGKNRWKQVKIVKTTQAIFVQLEFWRGCCPHLNCKPDMKWIFWAHSISSLNVFSICRLPCYRMFFKVLNQKFDDKFRMSFLFHLRSGWN